MANYTVAYAAHKTLGGSGDVATFSGGPFKFVEVLNRGTVDIYFVVGSATAMPTPGADNTDVVLPGGSTTSPMPADDVVKIISTGTPNYSLRAFNS